MSVLMELPGIYRRATERYRQLLADDFVSDAADVFTTGSGENRIVYGDNINVLAGGIRSGSLRGALDMIYGDPPFFTREDRGARIPVKSAVYPEIRELRRAAYNDSRCLSQAEYLEELAVRLMLMRDALAETGSIFIHLDTHAVFGVKLLMDEIFGAENFVNEIIWTYKSGGAAKRYLARKHDTILYYSKSKDYKFNPIREKSYNRGLKPYRFKGVEEFKDEIGWYTMVNQKDVWQIDMVGRSSGERLNYATQKPEALLDRIVRIATDPGDLCADFYCGSGTLAASAGRLGRRFFCVDQTGLAISNAMKRPLRQKLPFTVSRTSPMQDSTACSLASSLKGIRQNGKIMLVPAEQKKRRNKKYSAFEQLRRGDPMALVDFWCTGTADEFGNFCSYSAMLRNPSGKLEVSAEEDGATHLCLADICGGFSLLEIED